MQITPRLPVLVMPDMPNIQSHESKPVITVDTNSIYSLGLLEKSQAKAVRSKIQSKSKILSSSDACSGREHGNCPENI